MAVNNDINISGGNPTASNKFNYNGILDDNNFNLLSGAFAGKVDDDDIRTKSRTIALAEALGGDSISTKGRDDINTDTKISKYKAQIYNEGNFLSSTKLNDGKDNLIIDEETNYHNNLGKIYSNETVFTTLRTVPVDSSGGSSETSTETV